MDPLAARCDTEQPTTARFENVRACSASTGLTALKKADEADAGVRAQCEMGPRVSLHA